VNELDNCRVIEQPDIPKPSAHVMAFVNKLNRLHERAEQSYAESKRGFGGNTTPRRSPR